MLLLPRMMMMMMMVVLKMMLRGCWTWAVLIGRLECHSPLTVETGGLGGESLDRVFWGGFFSDPDCSIWTKEEENTERQTGDSVVYRKKGNMEVLSALNLGDFPQTFSKLGMFPVFDLAYYIVSILYLKYEPGECVTHFPFCFGPALFFTLKALFTTWWVWLSTVLYCLLFKAPPLFSVTCV